VADDVERSSRTEPPSERRLQQAFDEGDIALSRELVTTGAFALGLVALLSLAGTLERQLTQLVADTLTLAPATPFASLPSRLRPLVLPVAGALGAMALGALALTFAQTRAHLWSDRVSPDLSRVFNPERLGRLVSKDFAVDLLVATVKVVAIGVASWGVVRGEFLTLGRMGHSTPAAQLAQLFGGLWKIALRSLALLLVFAGADFALTRWRYRKRHMMTKDELKREMKDDEGDPLLRGARKRRHRELVRRNALHETRRADALVVNPTHIAIAIRYRKDEGAAPRVLAKGKGVLAEAMREAARSATVPIIQDIPLARLLYKKVKVGAPVPADTYKAVAAVLAVVFRMTGRSMQAGREAQP
jgi:flagellar biosynthesis protein FlhB